MKSFTIIPALLLSLCIEHAHARPQEETHRNGIRSTTSSKVSHYSTCGGTKGYTCLNSAFGNCCSANGWCGSTSAYCGTGCQSGFGSCTSSGSGTSQKVSKDGECSANSRTCLGSSFGDCCSRYGYCGSSNDHCGRGCQTGFGTCKSSKNTAASSTPTATSSTLGATSTPSAVSSGSPTSSSTQATSSPSSLSSPYPCGTEIGCSMSQDDFLGQSLDLTTLADCKALCQSTGGCTFISFGTRTDGIAGDFCNLFGGTFADNFWTGTSTRQGCSTAYWYDVNCTI